jgi:hypothetical protein
MYWLSMGFDGLETNQMIVPIDLAGERPFNLRHQNVIFSD